MTIHSTAAAQEASILKIAVLAVGGQGGGVLTNWIAGLAREGGYAVQATSVAGVAQRTGATIYYIEMAPKSARQPVFALSPSPGDIDVLVAAEVMEAGRAVLRGFVTPDRTTLIASSHRILAVSEKETPGDGRADDTVVTDELRRAARKLICLDLEKIASEAGSVISASLFGALARSKALPFETEQFEAVIKASGKGAQASLAAFRGALEDAPDLSVAPEHPAVSDDVEGPAQIVAAWEALVARVSGFPVPVQDMVRAGLRKTVDYQDTEYGSEYLDRLQPFAEADRASEATLVTAAAKHVANAMCYDDLPRVADLKTRPERAKRLRSEQDIEEDAIAHVTEYFHPRAEEVCLTLPARLGAAVLARPRLVSLLDRLVNRGRHIRTDSVVGFALLWGVSCLRPWRRHLLRHRGETAHLDHLSKLSLSLAVTNPGLATGVLACQRLIKGYSDTHARGKSKCARVLETVPLLKDRADGADWMARLCKAALQDEEGAALDGAIATFRSFAAQAGQ